MRGFSARLFNTWLLTVAVSCCLSGCSGKNTEVQRKLNNAYEQLYHLHYLPNYPANSEILRDCQINVVADYLRAYGSVLEAKQVLQLMIAKDAQTVFNYTLATIEDACLKIRPGTNDKITDRCYGAVSSFYLFWDADIDKRLRDYVAHASPAIVRVMFEHRYGWFYNRSNVDAWIAVIDALPADVLSVEK